MLLAGAFGGRLRLFHFFRHLCLDGIKVETRASLHRWEFEEGLEFLAHHLLDEHKAPELELDPVEVLLSSFFCPVVWRGCALERIEGTVDYDRHGRVGLGTKADC